MVVFSLSVLVNPFNLRIKQTNSYTLHKSLVYLFLVNLRFIDQLFKHSSTNKTNSIGQLFSFTANNIYESKQKI